MISAAMPIASPSAMRRRRQYHAAIAAVTARTGRAPDEATLAKELGITVEKLRADYETADAVRFESMDEVYADDLPWFADDTPDAFEQLAESVIGDNPRKMECVWYIGSSLANEKVEDGLNGPEDLLAAMRPLWLLVEEAAISSFDSVLANIGFHKKRLAAFRRWADTPEHPMEAKAQVYLDMVQIVQPQNASHKEENHSLHVLEEECSAYYLQHEVDMVFCTNEKSAQGLLGKYYRPSFILQDNAAEINVPEAATPLAAFVESVELLVQAGGRTQQRPKLASQGFNEHLGMLLKSPMDLISVNELLQRICTEL